MNPVRKQNKKQNKNKILLLFCFFPSKMKIYRIQEKMSFSAVFLNALYSILSYSKQDLMLRYPSEILKMKYIMHGQIGICCRCQHYMQ